MTENVFLIGFMGVGKSTVGKALAVNLGVPHVDSDAEIERIVGKTISDMFAEDGEEYFREKETEFLRALSKDAPVVVSCGGGLILRDENLTLMKACGKAVYLTATPETIYARVCHSTHRPLLSGRMDVASIQALMEERRECYERAAELTVTTDGKSTERIAFEIQRILFPSSQRAGSRA